MASPRPSDPPTSNGFPVTTPNLLRPFSTENSSAIHAMIWGLVYTSGAGMSFSGPTIGSTARMYPRDNSSNSRGLNSFESTITPPLAPPRGIPTTAHLIVIHMANAFTSSMSTSG